MVLLAVTPIKVTKSYRVFRFIRKVIRTISLIGISLGVLVMASLTLVIGMVIFGTVSKFLIDWVLFRLYIIPLSALSAYYGIIYLIMYTTTITTTHED